MLKQHLDDGLAEHVPDLCSMVSAEITQLQDKAWVLVQPSVKHVRRPLHERRQIVTPSALAC